MFLAELVQFPTVGRSKDSAYRALSRLHAKHLCQRSCCSVTANWFSIKSRKYSFVVNVVSLPLRGLRREERRQVASGNGVRGDSPLEHNNRRVFRAIKKGFHFWFEENIDKEKLFISLTTKRHFFSNAPELRKRTTFLEVPRLRRLSFW
jgi:hypothetical protein